MGIALDSFQMSGGMRDKNKVNEICPDIRKVAGLPIMRSLIEPLGRSPGDLLDLPAAITSE